MTQPFYEAQTDVAVGSRGKSSDINNLDSAVEQAFKNVHAYGVDSGTSSAYAITMDTDATAYYDGMVVMFAPDNTNTVQSPTINVNGLGAKATYSANQLSGIVEIGEIKTGHIYTFVYNATVGVFSLQGSARLNSIPGPIGSDTPSTGAFTTVTATGRIAAGWTQVQAYESAYGAAGNKSLFACSNTAGEASQALAQFNDASTASSVNFVKGRGTVSAGTIVQSGDNLGGIYFYGAASSSAIALAASIAGVVDGTPGASNDMPGRLVFSVSPDGSATAVEALRISNDKTAQFAGNVKCTAGTGTGQPAMVGTLSVNTTAVGNVGAGLDDLMTYALPANSLSSNGKGVRVTMWGTFANNANAKEVYGIWGAAGSLGFDLALPTGSAGSWRIDATVIRSGSNAQVISWVLQSNTNAGGSATSVCGSGTATESDSGAITIKCVASAVADNDVVQSGMVVEFLN